MFHRQEIAVNKATGVPVPGVIVRLYDADSNPVSLYSDTNGTPIITVSGIANAAVADMAGNYSYYVNDGLYTERLYIGDAEFFAIPDLVCQGLVALDLASTATGKGAALMGFLQAGTGAVSRTAQDKMRDSVSVLDYGAVIDGATDTTAASNLATGAADTFSSALRREVKLANGTTVWGASNTSLFVRKGQTLSGTGMGSSWVDASSSAANTNPLIKCGAKSDGTSDGSGDAVDIRDLSVLGGPTSAAVIDANSCSGYTFSNIFFSSPGIGMNLTGGDGVVHSCIFDDGLNGLVVSGGNLLISNCLFYLANQQITLSTGARDVNLNVCHHEYFKIYAILLAGDGMKNISIRSGTFLQNQQFASSHAIFLTGNNNDIFLTGLTFRNLAGAGFKYGSGVGNTVVIENCLFDGNKTLAAYAQSTTMQGVDATNLNIVIRNCTFRNLPGQPIAFGGNEISSLTVENCRFENCTGGTTEISVSNTSASSKVRISNCYSSRGQDKLVNSQATVPVAFTAADFRGVKTLLGADIVNPSYPYIVQWSNEVLDTDGFMDQATDAGRFTIPVGKGIKMVRLTAYIIVANFNAGPLLLQIRDTETGTTDAKTVAGQAATFLFGTQPITASAVVGDGATDLGGRWFDVRVYSTDTTTNIASGAYGSYFALEVLG